MNVRAKRSEVAGPVAPVGRTVLKKFSFGEVTLLPGMFLDQVEQARAIYASIPNDNILKGFRREAGMAAPGDDMKGWASATSAVIFGQLMSGMVRLGKATGDDALVQKAIALFEGWRATVGEDGNARMRAYDWDKLVGGLVDLIEFAGVTEAVAPLKQTVAWAIEAFDRQRAPADGHDFWGAGNGDTSEWYTLSENLYRAYFLTGDTMFRDFADVWLYHDYWKPFETSPEAHVLPVHAYSHVNSFSSAAAAYLASGDPKYVTICTNGNDHILATQCYATGAYGPDERLMPPDGSLSRSLDVNAYQAEVPCGSWAAFKLSMYLIGFTGNARFGDWIETLLYNGMGASLPPEPDGKAFYYADYRISGATKTRYWHEWPCCSGTYIQNVAAYHDMIYLHDDAGLTVNLYVPSVLRWRFGGEDITVRQETAYPEQDTSAFTLSGLSKPTRFAVRFRVPAWTKQDSVAVNGSSVAASRDAGGWLVIERDWTEGDRIAVTLPMALRTVPIDRQHPDRAAIMYGPVVLAQDEACCRRPFSIAPATALGTRLVKEAGPLRFRILNTVPERHTRYLEPLYRIKGFWPYWVYFDLHAPPLY